MKYYDLNIQGNSYEFNKELILEANRFRWNYLNLVYTPERYFDALEFKDELIEDINSIKNSDNNNNPIEVDFGVQIDPKNQNDMHKVSRKIRDNTKFISVLGGDLAVNRAVCESSHIDVLSRPYIKQKSCGINHVLAKEAVRNNVAIELVFNDILSSYLTYRSKIMAHFREIIKLHQKFNFPLIISSGSSSIWDIRSPRDILAVFESLGLSQEELQTCIYDFPKRIVEFNNEREDMVVLGVKKVHDN